MCLSQSASVIFNQTVRLSSSESKPKVEVASDLSDPLKHYDYFGVTKLFTVKNLFDSRMHLGHTVRSLEPQMSPFVYGER